MIEDDIWHEEQRDVERSDGKSLVTDWVWARKRAWDGTQRSVSVV